MPYPDLLSLTQRSSQFRIQGQDYHINIGGLYNIYNALAAVSVAGFFGVQPEVIKQGFDRSRAVFGRQETFKIGDKECTLVLIKNPVGATQAIEMIKLAPYPSACPFFSTPTMQMESIRAGFGMQISSNHPNGHSRDQRWRKCATLRLLDDFGSLAILQKDHRNG